jgi:RNA polymerase sigma-54 factor
MKNRLNASQKVEQRTSLRVDPKLVVASRVLELQHFELEQLIEQELNDNPALERLEEEPDEFDERSIARELARRPERQETEEPEHFASREYEGDEGVDWIDFLAAPVSLRDHLLGQLLPVVPKHLSSLVHEVVDCVNGDGYLDLPIEEIALLTNSKLEDVEDVVEKLQGCDPAGVGAHNLQECLELQLKDEMDDVGKLAYAIVRHHWEDLISRKTSGIARKHRVHPSLVEESFRKITTLSPRPGEAFVAASPSYRREESASVTPDLIFKRDESGLYFEIRGCDPNSLMVDEWYRKRHEDMKKHNARSSEDEKKHVGEFVGRATRLIHALRQRKATLRKIANYLLEEQAGFIATGSYRFLRPLTRVALAKAVHLHESTISRATMNKFVQLPNGEVISFEVFFKPQLRVQMLIEEILQSENPAAPLSDRAIAELLRERGVDIARRTVNKYREQVRLLSSHQRRTA